MVINHGGEYVSRLQIVVSTIEPSIGAGICARLVGAVQAVAEVVVDAILCNHFTSTLEGTSIALQSCAKRGNPQSSTLVCCGKVVLTLWCNAPQAAGWRQDAQQDEHVQHPCHRSPTPMFPTSSSGKRKLGLPLVLTCPQPFATDHRRRRSRSSLQHGSLCSASSLV